MYSMAYDLSREVLGVAEVMERSAYLKNLSDLTDRTRIRSVMNGGAQGVQAVLNSAAMSQQLSLPSGFGIDLPTANIMYSSLERLAQRIGRQPTIKTDMIPTKDSTPARKKAEKRARIVSAWDEQDNMELQYPQIGRWLPGYGFTLHVIRERWFGDVTYPVAQLRDPFDVYPGSFGPNQQPDEVAVYRKVSHTALRKLYPQHAEIMSVKAQARQPRSNTNFGAQAQGQWEQGTANNAMSSNLTIVEYMCDSGTYVVCTDYELMLSYIPNPLYSGPAFVVTKRFAFDKLQGQFHHVFGLMAMMAKLNILGLIGVEDSTFRETNIIGEMVGNVYERGRFAVNEFEPGTRIEKPTSDQLQQTWQAINILERQFRIVAGYDVAQDGQSPNSFATGQGIKELGSSADQNVREYQTSIRYTVEALDAKRLEWEEVMHAHDKKNVYWFQGAKHSEETYIPSKDIAGDYRTKRVFGAMATFDESSKIIAGLQLVQARVMDRRTMQENLDGLENVSLINERIDQDQAKEMLLQSLGARAQQGDPSADMALVAIMDDPSTTVDTLKKLFTPQEPQMSPEEAAAAAGQGMGGPPGMGPGGPPGAGGGLEGGPPPPVQSILAQMEAEGGGAMTVGAMG